MDSATEEKAFLGDLSRSMLVYRRQNIVAESSRDAEFALDNTLFRFGWRFDVAIVEPNPINRYGTP
jgi:HK97 family phage major capsid protein